MAEDIIKVGVELVPTIASTSEGALLKSIMSGGKLKGSIEAKTRPPMGFTGRGDFRSAPSYVSQAPVPTVGKSSVMEGAMKMLSGVATKMLLKLGLIGIAVSILSSLGPIMGMLKLIFALLQITLRPIAMFLLGLFRTIMVFLLRWLIIPVYKWLQSLGIVKADPGMEKMIAAFDKSDKYRGAATRTNIPGLSAGGPVIDAVNWIDWITRIDWNTWISTLSWPDWITNLTWPDWVKNLDWPDWIKNLSWPNWIKDLKWSDWIKDLKWPDWIKELKWPDWLKNLKWSDWISNMGWSDWITKIDWWGWIPKINWSSFIPKWLGGSRAGGGPVSGGSSYLVGEKGPELFTPGSSGGITPNNQMGGTTINVTGNTFSNRSDIDYMVKEIEKRLYTNGKRSGQW